MRRRFGMLIKDMEDSSNNLVNKGNAPGETETLVENALYRFTSGMPRRELDMMVQESIECEKLLLQDIDTLEKALSGDKDCSEESVRAIFESPLTPLDRFWSASALMGRLRNEMQVLPPPNSIAPDHVPGGTRGPKRVDDEGRLQSFLNQNMKLYAEEIVSSQILLGLWKKISSSKAALVFKKPVRDEEAPGYSDRIKFPVDLSLIRKRIVANDIQTFASFHAAIGLISHNCVKYNGRDSEYGRVARDFESMADSQVFQAMLQVSSGTGTRKVAPVNGNLRLLVSIAACA